jgi:ATP-dependent protease ClpP protease subunit
MYKAKTIKTEDSEKFSFGRVEPKSISSVHEFYLNEEVETSRNYIEWFDTIRHARENDVIKIYINSYGGDLSTAMQFMRVLSETEATVVASVEGMCFSAATFIFMCAQVHEVTPHSMFMFHNYSGGAFGKGGEMIDQLAYERKWSEKFLSEIYKDFLTPEEIKSMLDNKDIWMDSEEVVKRLKNRLEKRKPRARAEKQEKNATPAAKEKPQKTQPVRKTTKSPLKK